MDSSALIGFHPRTSLAFVVLQSLCFPAILEMVFKSLLFTCFLITHPMGDILKKDGDVPFQLEPVG